MTSGELKQLKVDNWGVFFLQRLQILHNKGELCDLTLKFKNGKPIKVHKLVLTACTDYFENLPRNGSELQMPSTLKHEHVLPIVNFMYTGRLEYNSEEHAMFYETAKALNLTILARLLNAQVKPKASSTPSVIKSYARKSANTPATTTPPAPSPTPSTSSPAAASTPTALPGKKLPIWKKRTVPGFSADDIQPSEITPVKVKAEVARPTRFEWPEDVEEPPVVYNPTFDNLSYDTKPMLKPVDNLTPLNVVLKGASGATDTLNTTNVYKRTGPSIVLGGSRMKRVKLSERVFSAPESDDDDDDHFETHYLNNDDDDDEDYLPPTPITSSKLTSPKPILKPLSSDSATPSPGKKVRFSLSTSEGKENTTVKEVITANEISTPTTNISVTSEITKSASSANHAKIIAEVLKKYPDLVKGNKNIKLKIVTPGTGGLPTSTLQTAISSDKDSKSMQAKVSYVVVKSDTSVKKANKPIVPLTGAENTTGPWMCITCGTSIEPMQFETYYSYRKHLHNVHNERIDARICEHCGYKASKRNLHLYHLYTRHNIPPPRNINFPKCDKCEYIALSESLLIKHRNNHSASTKDYVCRICNTAFKSNGALQGHMQTNLHQEQSAKKDYECEYCGKIFNRNINLKAHIRTAHQEESRKLYDDEERVDDPMEGQQSDQSILQVIEVPVINSVQSNEKGQHALLIQPGMTILAESPTVPLMPSSESEAMNNVASGIATSINIADASNMVSEQTVILLDENSEFILQSTPMVLNQDDTCPEYIVPEIMTSESGQVYATGLVNYSVGNGIYSNNVVENNMTEENMIKSSDHTYADDGSPHLGHSNVQVNGCTEVRVRDNITHDNSHHQGVIIISSSDEIANSDDPQVTGEILIDNSSGTLLMDADWVHVTNISHETEITEDKSSDEVRKDLDVITQDSGVESGNLSSSVADNDKTSDGVNKMADNLAKEWDLDDDTAEDVDEVEDSDVKPSRPTIELDETIIPDWI